MITIHSMPTGAMLTGRQKKHHTNDLKQTKRNSQEKKFNGHTHT